MKYARQPYSPDWYQSDDSKIYESAQSGSSPFNEWYEFDHRQDALDLMGKSFNSQSYHDRFVWFGLEIYATESFTEESMATADSADSFVLLPGSTPANLGEVIEAESRF